MARPRGQTVWRRVTLTIPDDILERIDAEAAEQGQTRSSWMVAASLQALPRPDVRLVAVDDQEEDAPLLDYLRRVGGRHHSDP